MTPTLLRRLAHRRESELQAAVLAVFRGYGVAMWKTNREKAGRRYAPHVGFRGLPDLSGVLPGGRAIFVEIKLPGKKPTPNQRGALAMLHDLGAFVCTVSSVEQAQGQAEMATERARA